MKLTLLVLTVASVALGSPTKKYARDYNSVGYDLLNNDPALATSSAQILGAAPQFSDPPPVTNRLPPPKTGYSAGGGLVSIAQGAANQAHSAIANQFAAADQAAYVAKNQIAQSAAQSAATAQAALAGKQVILSGLEQQVRDAKVAVDGEKMQLMQAQRAATAGATAAQQAMHQLQVATQAMNAAQATSDHSAQAAAEASAELAAQTTMVGQAKARLQTLIEQLVSARIDFDATQSASLKAQALAQRAQNTAAASAAQAAQSSAAASAQNANPIYPVGGDGPSAPDHGISGPYQADPLENDQPDVEDNQSAYVQQEILPGPADSTGPARQYADVSYDDYKNSYY